MIIENLHLKSLPPFAHVGALRGSHSHFFLVVMLHVTPNELSVRGTTRSVDTSKGEVFRVVHVWKFYLYFILLASPTYTHRKTKI